MKLSINFSRSAWWLWCLGGGWVVFPWCVTGGGAVHPDVMCYNVKCLEVMWLAARCHLISCHGTRDALGCEVMQCDVMRCHVM